MAGVKVAVFCCALLAAFPGFTQNRNWEALTSCWYVPHANNDGDSFHVKCGGEEFVLRLYFVDAPEADKTYPERNREQAGYFGVGMDEAQKGGAQAREYVRGVLWSTFTVHTKRSVAPGRGAGARYYGMVRVDGRQLDALLVGNGLARIKGAVTVLPDGTKSAAYKQALQKLENEARRERRGLWAASRK